MRKRAAKEDELIETHVRSITLGESDPACGSDSLPLAEFPLAACGHRTNPDQKSISFEDEIFDKGNQKWVQRKLVVSASDAFGLPTPLDSDVLLVLMHLTRCQTGFQTPTVTFTRYELVKFLGWENNGGKGYKRLEESLQRWSSVTLYYNRAWWDRDRRRWRSLTFHVLESLDLRGKDDLSGAPDDDGKSSFTWNKELFASFQANHLKRLDLNRYFQLQIPAARQAYRFLDKRFYRKKTVTMDLRVFACEHVGLGRGYDIAQLKRALAPALKELETVGFLVPATPAERFLRVGHGKWQVVLTHQRSPIEKSALNPPTDSVAVELVKRGLRPTIAAEIVRKYPAARVTEKIELHDWMVEHKDRGVSRNPAGFLAAAIRDDYALPKGFVTRAERTRQQQKAAAKRMVAVASERTNVQRTDARQVALKYRATLSDAERREVEKAALEAGSSDDIAQYRKLGNSNLGPMLLKELVVTYLLASGRLNIQAA